MKTFAVIAAVAALASQANAHYIFETLSVAGTKYSTYQYIRENTNYNSPVTNLTSDDMRCNVGGLVGGSTATVAVAAGSAVGFTPDVAVYHQGPVSFYMSKVPAGMTADTYDGSGDWFKIKDIGPTFTSSGATWDLSDYYEVDIPACLANGDYLLKIQQMAIHNPAGAPQFYSSCAQMTITGGSGAGTPSPTVEIPGYITGNEPGYTVNIYNNFNNYTVPGPAVWTC